MISYERLMIVLRSSVRAATPAPSPAVPEPPAALNGHGYMAAERYADDLAVGKVPGTGMRRDLKVGQPRAQQVQTYLAALAQPEAEGRSPL